MSILINLKQVPAAPIFDSKQIHGRNSVAMFELIEYVRVLQENEQDGETRRIIWGNNDPVGAYHGHYRVGPINASLPANRKERKGEDRS
ncbi:MAG: hypothetical protein HRU41_13975 [Saprospiraceae bacterium]|nr:hypothetical protein [Saprospiraceae bacterium]